MCVFFRNDMYSLLSVAWRCVALSRAQVSRIRLRTSITGAIFPAHVCSPKHATRQILSQCTNYVPVMSWIVVCTPPLSQESWLDEHLIFNFASVPVCPRLGSIRWPGLTRPVALEYYYSGPPRYPPHDPLGLADIGTVILHHACVCSAVAASPLWLYSIHNTIYCFWTYYSYTT